MRPSIPPRKNSGMNATMVMIVACTIEVRISVDASYTTVQRSEAVRLSGAGKFCLEPFEDVLHVDDRIVHQRSDGNGHTTETHRVDGKAPSALSARIDTSNESGSATSEMTVVRTFIRKKNNTTTTKNAPSNRAFRMLSIDPSIKRA